jgi:hypothetical protein
VVELNQSSFKAVIFNFFTIYVFALALGELSVLAQKSKTKIKKKVLDGRPTEQYWRGARHGGRGPEAVAVEEEFEPTTTINRKL